jgi:hypothetical protein
VQLTPLAQALVAPIGFSKRTVQPFSRSNLVISICVLVLEVTIQPSTFTCSNALSISSKKATSCPLKNFSAFARFRAPGSITPATAAFSI